MSRNVKNNKICNNFPIKENGTWKLVKSVTWHKSHTEAILKINLDKKMTTVIMFLIVQLNVNGTDDYENDPQHFYYYY